MKERSHRNPLWWVVQSLSVILWVATQNTYCRSDNWIKIKENVLCLWVCLPNRSLVKKIIDSLPELITLRVKWNMKVSPLSHTKQGSTTTVALLLSLITRGKKRWHQALSTPCIGVSFLVLPPVRCPMIAWLNGCFNRWCGGDENGQEFRKLSRVLGVLITPL